MTGEPARLMPDTDRLSAPTQQAAPEHDDSPFDPTNQQLMRRNAAMGTLDVVARGLDPLTTTPRFGGPIPFQVEIERRFIFEKQRNQQMNDAIFANPESGWHQIKGFMDDVFARYKSRNEEQAIKKPRTQEEAMAQAAQMQPITVDPNEIANIRQMAVKLDQQMKAIDPRTSFWTDPRTKKYAQWLNREAGGTGYGYLTSGEQKLDLGVTGTAAMAGIEAIEGAADFGTNLVHGLWDISRQSVEALGGGDIGALTPTNYIEGADGKLYSNGGKAPTFLDAMTSVWAVATDRNVQQEVARMGRTRELEVASRNGFQTVLLGASRIAGMGVGFGVPAGAAMKGGAALFGGLSTKGLQALGALRLGKGLAESERAIKIIRAMSAGTGAAVANGLAEAGAYGRLDGYGKSFMHGMAMAPVLMAVGAMGRKAEWFAANRAKMPARVAQLVGAGMEGVGFGAMEAHFPDLLPAAWGFIRDPNEDTWKTYAKNMAGFMMFSVASRGRSVNPADQQVRRGAERRQFAERVARGEVSPEELNRAPTTDVQSLRDIGEASQQARTGSPESRAAAQERLQAAESERDVREMGLEGPATRSVEGTLGDLLRRRQATEQGYQGEAKAERIKELEASDPRAKERKLSQEQFDTEMEGLRGELKAARDADARKEAIRKIRELEQRQKAGDGDVVDLGDKMKLEFREGQTGKEWVIRDESGDIVGAGAFTDKGKSAEIHNAEIREEHRGKGLYTKVVEEMKRRYPEGLESVHQEPGAKRAHEKAAAGETTQEIQRGQGHGPGGERGGVGSFQVPPTRQVEPTEGTVPLRASDIIKEMEGRPGRKGFRIPLTSKRIGGTPGDPVRTTFRSGKIPGRGVQGYFAFYQNLIRNKEGRDLGVAAHEWSHAMHRHLLGEGGRGYPNRQLAQLHQLPTDVVNDIFAIVQNYPGIQNMPAHAIWAETWAEWHARNLLGDTRLDTEAPNLSRWMREWLAKPEQSALRGQYQRIQEMMHRYNAQGSVERVRQSIVLDSDPETVSERAQKAPLLQRASDAVTKALFDDMIELKRAQDRVLEMTGRSPEGVSIGEDPARVFDALRMTAGKTAEHFVMHGIRGPGGSWVPGLREALRPVSGNRQKAEDLYTYLVSRRNLELYEQGRTVQLPPRDYAESIRQLESLHPDLPEIADSIKSWTDALVDYVGRSGNLSPESVQRLKNAYTVYVPFFRALEGPRKHAGNRGVAERGSGLSNIEGSTYEIRDPLVALQEVATTMIAKAHQNQVVTALYKMAAGQEAGTMATVIPRALVPKDHPIAQLLNLIEKKLPVPPELQTQVGEMFEILRDIDKIDPGVITTFTQKVIPTGEKAVIAYTPRLTDHEIAQLEAQGAHGPSLRSQNGSLLWLELDAKVYEAMMGIDKMPQVPEALQGVMRVLQAPRDLVRFFATGVSPGFTVANLIRDALTQPLFSRNGTFRPFGGFINVIRGAIEYHRNGRMRELYDELGVSTSSFYNEGIKRQVAGQATGFRQKFVEWTSRVQHFFSHPENYLRMAEFSDAYLAARRRGLSEADSRLEALEAGKELMNFARAGIVSRVLNQLVPYFNAGLVGKRKFYGQLLWGGDVKGDAAKARVQRATILNGIAQITIPSLALWLINKDENWYQDLPDWRKVNYWNVKMGDEIVSIPKPFEAGTIFGTLPEIVLDHQLADARPAELHAAAEVALGAYMEGIGNFIPAFLRPILEVTTNYDFFRGKEVTPDYVAESMKPEDQSTFYTTATARILSRAINGALTPIEIEQLLGGYTAGAATSGMRAMDEIAGLKDHPLGLPLPWARFFRQTPHRQSVYVSDLYDLSRDLDQRRDELTPEEGNLRTRVNRAKRAIGDLRRKSRDGSMSAEDAEKRAFEIAKPLIEQSRKR